MSQQAEIGKPEGRTPYSDFAEERYDKQRDEGGPPVREGGGMPMPEDLRGRTTRQVPDDHWWVADNGTVDQTMQRNIHPQVLLLTSFGEYTGHDGSLALYQRLREVLGEPCFDYRTRLAHGEVGFLEWTATGEGGRHRRRRGQVPGPRRLDRHPDHPLHRHPRQPGRRGRGATVRHTDNQGGPP